MFDRVSSETYNNGKQYLYHYDSEGSLAKQEVVNNGTTTEAYTYDYDGLGRLIHSKETNGSSMVQRTEHLYDTSNRLTKQNWMFHDGASVSQSYTYDPNNDTLTTLKSTVKIGSSTISPTVTYSYNTLRQLIRKTTGSKFYRAYDYKAGSTTSQTTAQVQWMNYLRPGNGTSDDPLILGYKYAYNSEGNISAVYPSLSESVASPTADQTYDYDDLGQLTGCVDERNGTVTYSYTYDTAGNIKTMTGGTGGSKTLTYGDSVWKDRLTKVQVGSTSENITYETAASGYISGNPTSYYNGRHYNFTWQQGRQLATSNVDGVTTTYTYDMAGVRSSKTVGSTTYHFDTLSGLVVRQTWGTKSLYFVYDDANQPYCIIYRKSPSASPLYYYYALNLQGDVVGIINGYGTLVCTYSYDPWGAVTVGEDDSSCGIGTLNPLRYRGYYYDTETGVYYLQSRYYDPAIGRFINADTFATTDANGFLSCNMFAYCENNPIRRADPNGEFAPFVIGAVVGAVTSIIGDILEGEDISVSKAVVSAIEGGLTAMTGPFVGALISGSSSFIQAKLIDKKSTNASIKEGLLGVGSSLVGRAGELIGGRIALESFKQTATKRGLKGLGSEFAGKHSNAYKNLSNWTKKMNWRGTQHFSNSKYGRYIGYLTGGGFEVSKSIIKGARTQ